MIEPFRIPLAPPDYPFTGPSPYSIQFAFFFRQPQPAQAISDALQQTLAQFYPVKGQLVLEENCFYLQPGASIRLEVIEHEECLPRVSLPSGLANFYQEVKAEVHAPLAQFCLHQYPDGSLLVANIAHCLVDGYSFFYFMSAWARDCRGEAYRLPCHDRARLIPDSIDDQAPQEETAFDQQFTQQTGLSVHQERQFPGIHEIVWEENRISAEQLDHLKARCLPDQPSDNAVLCAHLWKQYGQIWQGGEAPETRLSLSCALDFRRIYRKVIPPNYFGNAIKGTRCQLPLDHVRTLSLRDLAMQIQSSILGQRPGDIDQHLLALHTFRDRYGVKRMPCLHVSNPETGLLITNLSRIPLKDLDFGLGAPFAMVPLVSAARVGVILPSDGGLTVMMAHPLSS
ncbi:acyltransferase [Lyngbya confervoides]|uniref:Condensation domain-containing protein n=1 Tax=Lyngbya confervoides BDU141951 TaxID=1574623 RepID=A0ABD4T483_9CYAN|nr:acyltransferase [Lyngbya confervoides]MCM1983250.1 hypothetical protein [Lyngbya confervoides BDU141951]